MKINESVLDGIAVALGPKPPRVQRAFRVTSLKGIPGVAMVVRPDGMCSCGRGRVVAWHRFTNEKLCDWCLDEDEDRLARGECLY